MVPGLQGMWQSCLVRPILIDSARPSAGVFRSIGIRPPTRTRGERDGYGYDVSRGILGCQMVSEPSR